ncbi:hypothetical protein V5799_012281 [Amblyomma americanum]|uniref:Cytosolic endo-beta-N-acetylglucosaminidase TIM barrel domain-containing protein n=1 Tax=Amblyomma americanum TaxID=6943 RepID=A0AAQ4EEM5_AMBAM
MGVVPSRQPKRRPPPPRVIKFVPEVEAGPLTTLDELLSYKDPLLCAVEPLNATIRRGRPEDPKILVCHDMMGGYHDDRWARIYTGISCVPFVKDLLAAITEKTHRAIPGSLVIWYDAVDTRGMGKPHNELNERNSCFFGLCDGIFLNFRWTEDMLQRSAQLAGDRKADVYVGVDVFARNTPYLGGFNTPQVVKTVRAHGLSSAVFGPGWVYEKRLKTNYIKNQYRAGQVTTAAAHQVVCAKFASDRLFSCDFPVGSLTIRYTFKPVRDETSAGQDLALILKAKTGAGEAEELSLGSMVTQPDGNNYVLRRELPGIPDVSSDASTAKWVTRKYYVEDKRGVQGATLDEIGVRLFCAGPNANVCLLGQLDVKRPVESSAAEDPDAVAELSDVDYEPEEKRSRVHKSEESVATAENTE